MNDYSFFVMDSFFRNFLIERHLFFVAQAKRRLLSQFSNIEDESDLLAEEWLDSSNDYFDPDRHDPSDFLEKAHDMSIEYYQLLNEMHSMTRLNVVSGMFNLWEKSVREWIIKEVMHWHRGDHICKAVWAAKFHELMDFFTSLGWKIRDEKFFVSLNQCRHIVNVYKHGGGKSFEELQNHHPQFLKSHDLGFDFSPPFSHDDLTITDEDLDTFATAIGEFWQKLPADVRGSDNVSVPKWFADALKKDTKDMKGK